MEARWCGSSRARPRLPHPTLADGSRGQAHAAHAGPLAAAASAVLISDVPPPYISQRAAGGERLQEARGFELAD